MGRINDGAFALLPFDKAAISPNAGNSWSPIPFRIS